jgi:aryl-alcohol dehydrogenase-like predicted oxidoreductase
MFSNKLGLGTAQFGLDYGISNNQGQTKEAEVSTILKQALLLGITILDTAHQYGQSENVLGKNDLSNFLVVSKFASIPEETNLDDLLHSALIRLGVERLYGYMAHSSDYLLDNPDIWDSLVKLKSEGKVRKIGYSLYSPTQLEELLSCGMVPDLVQVPYNVFDRRFEPWLKILKDRNVEIHSRSAFLQGLFFMNPDELPEHFNSIKTTLKDVKNQFSSDNELSGALLYFCVSNPFIDKVIIGINNVDQLTSNITELNSVRQSTWKDYGINDNSILLPYKWPAKN